MEDVEDIKHLVENLEANIDEVETALKPLLNKDLSGPGVAAETPDPTQQAQLYSLLAYILEGLLFSYLKAEGVNTGSHDIMKQLERVKLYMDKVSRLKDRPVSYPHSKIDRQAAHNLVKHGIPSQGKGTHTKFA